MSSIWKYISDYYKKDLRLLYLLFVLVLLGILVWFNYNCGLEEKYIDKGNFIKRFTGYYLLHFVPFFLAYLLQVLFYKKAAYWKNFWFIIILFSAPAFFALKQTFNVYEPWITIKWTSPYTTFYLHSIGWIARATLVMIPVYIIWRIKDKSNQPLYGIAKMKTVKPYLVILACMLPLIALAATQKDFLQMYPRAQVLKGIPFHSIKDSFYYLGYELSYGYDFISIELFFRGFLILSLAAICGKQSIIPMAAFYCTIHFGKPMGEAISSFLGGAVLGIISYYTRSIRGGLIVHLGIAWSMELFGWLGHLLKY